MALGGDPPEDPDAGPGELAYAAELVELARAIGGFSVGVAAHPAGHPRSPDLAERPGLPGGQARAGRLRGHPVLLRGRRVRGPGRRPARARRRHARAARHPARHVAVDHGPPGRHGAAAPAWMQERLRAADERGGAEAVRKEGVELATELCSHLLESGVPGLHFYTFNTSSATREIYAALGLGPSTASAHWPRPAVAPAVQSRGRRRSPVWTASRRERAQSRSMLAPTRTVAAIATVSTVGTTVTGTAPRSSAKAFHAARPATKPSGTPTTTPIEGQRGGLPRNRRHDLAVDESQDLQEPDLSAPPRHAHHSRCASVAAPNTASIAPKMSGKSTASPKLTREVGATGCEVMFGNAAR